MIIRQALTDAVGDKFQSTTIIPNGPISGEIVIVGEGDTLEEAAIDRAQQTAVIRRQNKIWSP